MPDIFNEGSRQLQDQFDTRRLADRVGEIVHDVIDDNDRAFIERMDMFFLATVDEQGHANCSYKGGEPGFVRVVDESTIAFPSYDGNGMYLSLGNVVANPKVGLLFVDFERQRRMRLNGIASVGRQCRDRRLPLEGVKPPADRRHRPPAIADIAIRGPGRIVQRAHRAQRPGPGAAAVAMLGALELRHQ